MDQTSFPIIGTKVSGLSEKFDLADPETRRVYFQKKVGKEVDQIKTTLKTKKFIGYFLGKKNSGKGTYSKLFAEALNLDNITHLSVGDMVRELGENWAEFSKSPDFNELRKLYRGYISFDEAIQSFVSRNQSQLLPTEFVLALLKLKFEKLADKSVFLDGFPREQDQMSYSMFFKDIVNRDHDIDMYILIDIPDSVLNERIKYRVICPICHTPRNTKVLVTNYVGYDEKTKEFYLMCDNPPCNKARMVAKEGDDLGIGPIRDRLQKEGELIEQAYHLNGIPKILLRNSVPVNEAKNAFDGYEITPGYSFELDGNHQPKTIESPWIIQDNEGVESYSLLPGPVVVAMIKQMAEILTK